MGVYHLIDIVIKIDYQFDTYYANNLYRYASTEEPTHFIVTHLEIPKLTLPLKKKTLKKRFFEDDLYEYVLFVDDDEVSLNLIKRRKDFKEYHIYLNKDQQNLEGIEYTIHQMVFMEMALNRGFLPIHASAFTYKNKAILISAPSGTGKSTLSKRMQTLFDFPIINDDKPLLRLEQNTIYVYSSPFSGKEALNENIKLPLGLIVFLEHGKNTFRAISKKEAINEILKNVFRPKEDSLWNVALDIASRLIIEEKIIAYKASNDNEAAEGLLTHLKGMNL